MSIKIPTPNEVRAHFKKKRKDTEKQLDKQTNGAVSKCIEAIREALDDEQSSVVVDLSAAQFDDEHITHITKRFQTKGWVIQHKTLGKLEISFPECP